MRRLALRRHLGNHSQAQATRRKPASKSDETDSSKLAKGSNPPSESKDKSTSAGLPAGSVGLATAADGILLRYNAEQWESMKIPGPLTSSDRLLCLAPFRATITIGKMEIVLVDATELRILPQSADGIPAIELIQGRLLVRQRPAGSLKLALADHRVTVDQEANDDVAIERISRWEYGRIMNAAPRLGIYCIKGEISVSLDNKNKETLGALDSLAIDVAGGVKKTTDEPLPAWAGDTGPSARSSRYASSLPTVSSR